MRYQLRGLWNGAEWQDVHESEWRKFEVLAGFSQRTVGFSCNTIQGRIIGHENNEACDSAA